MDSFTNRGLHERSRPATTRTAAPSQPWLLAWAVGLMLWAAPAAQAAPASAPVQPTRTAQAVVERLAGDYALSGVREVAAGLRLHADGLFDYAISFGAVDQRAAGTWHSDGRRVWLQTKREPPSFRWGRALPEFYDVGGDQLSQPVVLQVRVEEPERRFIWSNVQIQAEFTNGQTRSGTTGRNGMVAFVARTDEPWRGHTVRRLGLKYREMPWTWFTLDEPMKTAVLYFRPGALEPAPFEQLIMNIEPQNGRVRELRVQQIDGETAEPKDRMAYHRQ